MLGLRQKLSLGLVVCPEEVDLVGPLVVGHPEIRSWRRRERGGLLRPALEDRLIGPGVVVRGEVVVPSEEDRPFLRAVIDHLGVRPATGRRYPVRGRPDLRGHVEGLHVCVARGGTPSAAPVVQSAIDEKGLVHGIIAYRGIRRWLLIAASIIDDGLELIALVEEPDPVVPVAIAIVIVYTEPSAEDHGGLFVRVPDHAFPALVKEGNVDQVPVPAGRVHLPDLRHWGG